ncbi:MAG: DUF2628 domain-containing protein [Rhizobiales bacterium]|nr:DUF2628 domain-containing protein [Hyphomicrobiales bacterium]
MASFRVFENPLASLSERHEGRDVRFIRDGFSFPAFLFSALWMLWHRLWIAFALIVLLGVLLFFVAEHSSSLFSFSLDVLLSIVIGLEATNFLARKLARDGWQETGVIVAGSLEEAETRFFTARAGEEDVFDKGAPNAHIITSQTPLHFAGKSAGARRPVIGGFFASPPRPSGSRG